MIDSTYIIKKAIVTEKSTALNEQGVYTFLVDRRASKDQIKKAVEDQYSVKVQAVRTTTRKGEVRRIKSGWVREPEVKKAMVKLGEGQTIELF